VGDILYAVRDPLTVPISRKITLNNLLIAINSLYVGWVPVTDAWTYASATTITVPSGAASLYNKGDKVRLKQGAGYKYYSVILVADTLLTVTGGSDYTVANAAITDIYYSKIENPLGFPTYFNFTATVSGSAGSIGTYAETNHGSRFRIVGSHINVQVQKTVTNVGSWTTNVYVLRPFVIASMTMYGLGGAIWANGVLAPKAYIDLGDVTYYRFDKLMASSLLQWADMAVNDIITIGIWHPY